VQADRGFESRPLRLVGIWRAADAQAIRGAGRQGVEAGAHAGLAGLLSTIVARPGWLAETVKPEQRSTTVGNVVVNAPMEFVTGRRTNVWVPSYVTRTRLRAVKPLPLTVAGS
jgi:hypothetical protein